MDGGRLRSGCERSQGRRVFEWKKAASFNLPSDFKLDAVEADPRGSDKLWTFTDYSYGGERSKA